MVKDIEYEDESNTIVKRAKIVFDGKQYLVRFPREIADYLRLGKGDSVEFKIVIPKTRGDEIKTDIQIIKRKDG